MVSALDISCWAKVQSLQLVELAWNSPNHQQILTAQLHYGVPSLQSRSCRWLHLVCSNSERSQIWWMLMQIHSCSNPKWLQRSQSGWTKAESHLIVQSCLYKQEGFNPNEHSQINFLHEQRCLLHSHKLRLHIAFKPVPKPVSVQPASVQPAWKPQV